MVDKMREVQRWEKGIQGDSSMGNGMEVLISLALYCPEYRQILNFYPLGFILPPM